MGPMAADRIVRLGLLAIVALAAAPVPAAESLPPEWVSESRAVGKSLMSQLKQRLGQAIAAGGPASAIDVCRIEAPAIAASLSEESGANVRRTALRVRNTDNAPDAFEREVLESFVDRLARGEPPASVDHWVERRVEGGVERRYMKAIVTEPLCLTCHGSVLAPEVAAAIERAYPRDQATGFAAGDLRGALSVTWSPVTD